MFRMKSWGYRKYLCFPQSTFRIIRNISCERSNLQYHDIRVENNSHLRASASANEFSRSKRGSFYQGEPQLENAYEADTFLQRNLKRLIPFEVNTL